MDGASVLVVGGTSGIGLATAERAAGEGARVTVAGRSDRRLSEIVGRHPGMTGLRLDVTDEDALGGILAAAGPFDHVVVTPGGVASQPVRGGDASVARAGFDLKFWGAYRIAALVGISDGGSLTLVSGVYSLRPAKGHVAASCANAAVEALARALALELSPVRVNAVSPGLVDTPLWSRMGEDDRRAMFAAAASSLPAQRTGTAEDVADLILTCMTNRMLTGSVIVADGGHVLI